MMGFPSSYHNNNNDDDVPRDDSNNLTDDLSSSFFSSSIVDGSSFVTHKDALQPLSHRINIDHDDNKKEDHNTDSSMSSSSLSSSSHPNPSRRIRNRRRLSSSSSNEEPLFDYMVCNGLSNQLLYHAAGIALASKKVPPSRKVRIPNRFVLNGAQTSTNDILPRSDNSVPLTDVFNGDVLVQRLLDLGIAAELVPLPDDDTNNNNNIGSALGNATSCLGMGGVQRADPYVMHDILATAFEVTPLVQDWIYQITQHLPLDGQGVCVHHRDGPDWHDHCRRWSTIPDGVYRGNCLEDTSPLQLGGRGGDNNNNNGGESSSLVTDPTDLWALQLGARGVKAGRWVYYCGDHAVPSDWKLALEGTQFFQRADLQNKERVRQLPILGNPPWNRDFWALIDFEICKKQKLFIGNSVSTFSALQIALRQLKGGAYWYNSQSIPLSTMWTVYDIPIVYTYTEQSALTGKLMLQASIQSVRRHMPRTPIHVLYHGANDTHFRQWLVKEQRVKVHGHDPVRRVSQFEHLRQNSNTDTSHLFAHAGNYFGTWQRIDIPLFVQAEYCLYLDSDTIVAAPFTLADFGLDMPRHLAFSSEINAQERKPWNAGVMLLNIPFLRHTYNDFLKYIRRVSLSNGKFHPNAPSDQGAYLTFYQKEVQFLESYFNYKPYWTTKSKVSPKVWHFHGPKPHDYIGNILGQRCPAAVDFLCVQGVEMSGSNRLCHSLRAFALELTTNNNNNATRDAYCRAAFPIAPEAAFCEILVTRLATASKPCKRFRTILREVLDAVPANLRLPREMIRQRFGWADPHDSAALANQAHHHGTDLGTVYFRFVLLALVSLTFAVRGRGYKTFLITSLVWVALLGMMLPLLSMLDKSSTGLSNGHDFWEMNQPPGAVMTEKELV